MPSSTRPTAIACTAERTVSRLLGGSCELPLGAYADWVDGERPPWLRAFVANLDGSEYVTAEAPGHTGRTGRRWARRWRRR